MAAVIPQRLIDMPEESTSRFLNTAAAIAKSTSIIIPQRRTSQF
jgi:hypothetical protein